MKKKFENWEIVKAHSEGKRVRYRDNTVLEPEWIDQDPDDFTFDFVTFEWMIVEEDSEQ